MSQPVQSVDNLQDQNQIEQDSFSQQIKQINSNQPQVGLRQNSTRLKRALVFVVVIIVFIALSLHIMTRNMKRETGQSKPQPLDVSQQNKQIQISQCSKNCQSCTTSTSCDVCRQGTFYRKSRNQCLECSDIFSECAQCTTQNFETTCKYCMNGFYLSNTQCLQCPQNCNLCINGNSCSFCKSSDYLYQTKNNKCVLCTDAFPNCIKCAESDSKVVCSGCNKSYFFNSDSSTCEKCIDNCLTCENKNSCTTCAQNYYFQPKNQSCKAKAGPIQQQMKRYKFRNKSQITEKQLSTLCYWKLLQNKTNDQTNYFKQKEINYFEQKYNVSKYQGEIQMCVLIFSFNNQANQRYRKNLDSIFQQNYSNYKVVYVDDFSKDKTEVLVKQYIKNHQLQDRIKFFRTKSNRGKAQNLYYFGKQHCKPGTIMLAIDGDDQLIGLQVFKVLNAVYQANEYYFVYTQNLIILPQSKSVIRGWSQDIPQQNKINVNYRKDTRGSQLRTWASDIFLDLKQQDLRYKGGFPMVTEDLFYQLPMMEKSGEKVYFLNQYLYRYNAYTGVNDGALRPGQQKKAQLYVRGLTTKFPKYTQQINFKIEYPKNSTN